MRGSQRFETTLAVVAVLSFLGCGSAAAATDFPLFYVSAVYWGGLVLHQVDLVTRQR